VESHEQLFHFLTATDRLKCGGITFAGLRRLRESLDAMIQRGARMCYEDVLAALKVIEQFPHIGGQKGALTMVDQLMGKVGETSFKEIKDLAKEFAEDSWQERKAQSTIEGNMHDRKSAKHRSSDLIRSEGVHDIWSIDFTEAKVFGMKVYGCVVYELYSQGYMAFEISLNNDATAACNALHRAIKNSGGVLPRILVSDNGSHFVNEMFKKAVGKKILHHLVAPGKPWLNGALESGNRDLKKMLYSRMMYNLEQNDYVSQVGVSAERILSFTRAAAKEAMDLINTTLVRKKFRVTPQVVIDGKVEECILKQNTFRKERDLAKVSMLKSARETGKKLKTLKQKAKRAWNTIVKKMSDDKLYAFRELINGRFQAVKC